MTPQASTSLSGVRARLFHRMRALSAGTVGTVTALAVVVAHGGSVQAQAELSGESPAPPPSDAPSAELPIQFADPVAAPPVAAPLPEASDSVRPAPPEIDSSLASPDESYIDRTDYNLGATQRSTDTTAVARPPSGLPQAPTSVRIGPIAVTGSGLQVVGLTTPAALDYYRKLSLRPPLPLGQGKLRLIFPLAIPAPITSVFGWRIHPVTGEPRFHAGTDLGAPLGTPVLAAYAGRVALADFLGGYGLAIALEHNGGAQQTLYGHLSEIFVQPGQWVKQGTAIGRVGNTGMSTGPHLHFEFRQLTPEGWVAMDAGQQLEYALAQLVKGIQVGQTLPQDLKTLPSGKIGQVNGGAAGLAMEPVPSQSSENFL